MHYIATETPHLRLMIPGTISLEITYSLTNTSQTLTNTSQTPHKHITNTSQTPHRHLTNISQTPHKHLTNASQTPHIYITLTGPAFDPQFGAVRIQGAQPFGLDIGDRRGESITSHNSCPCL